MIKLLMLLNQLVLLISILWLTLSDHQWKTPHVRCPGYVTPPPWKGFFLRPPPLWKFQSSFIHLLKVFGPLRTPHPIGNFQSLQWGEYGYFLALHILLTKKRFKKGLILEVPRVTNINCLLLVHTIRTLAYKN